MAEVINYADAYQSAVQQVFMMVTYIVQIYGTHHLTQWLSLTEQNILKYHV